ncbi:MAG: hypothetical protein Q9216_004163 [Gyalolechia sp. 2 TL-2023]
MLGKQIILTSVRNDAPATMADLQKRHGASVPSALLLVKCEDREMSNDAPKTLPRPTVSHCSGDVKVVPADKPFPFMKLPPELRQMIYKDLLVQSHEITITDTCWSLFGIRDGPVRIVVDDAAHSPSATCKIFRVSKACYNEAMPIYFGCNSFAFESLDLLLLLEKGKADYRRNIKSLSVHFCGKSPAKAARMLRGCTALRELSVQINHGTLRYGKSEFLPLLKSNGINDLLKVRGISELNVTKPEIYKLSSTITEEWEPFVEAMQVLKQPRSAAALRYRYAKDYPPERAKRVTFGKANVATRSEKRILKNAGKEQEGIDG